MTLSDIFMKPLNARLRAARAMAKSDMAAMINRLEEFDLRRAVDEGAATAARYIGVDVDRIWQAVPDERMHTALQAVGVAQQAAVKVWNDNQSSWLGFVEKFVGGFVDGYFGTEELGLGDALASFAGGKLRQTRFQKALQDLAAAISEFEAAMADAAQALDADEELATLAAAKADSKLGCGLLLAFAGIVVGAVYGGWHCWSTREAPTAAMASTGATSAVQVPTTPTATSPPSATASASNAARPSPAPAMNRPPTRSSRKPCIQACIASCHDDANCERSCVASCPPG